MQASLRLIQRAVNSVLAEVATWFYVAIGAWGLYSFLGFEIVLNLLKMKELGYSKAFCAFSVKCIVVGAEKESVDLSSLVS